jgi:hypothetical protein
VIVGSNNSVSAPSPQTLGASSYTYQSWSDGGAQTHNLTAPATATTYTATYQGAPAGCPTGPVPGQLLRQPDAHRDPGHGAL